MDTTLNNKLKFLLNSRVKPGWDASVIDTRIQIYQKELISNVQIKLKSPLILCLVGIVNPDVHKNDSQKRLNQQTIKSQYFLLFYSITKSLLRQVLSNYQKIDRYEVNRLHQRNTYTAIHTHTSLLVQAMTELFVIIFYQLISLLYSTSPIY